MQFNRRTLIIVTSILGVGLIGLAIFGFTRSINPADEKEYTDPGSGEIIRNDKSQQGTDLSLEKTTVWLGFSSLIERGLTPNQITAVQATITKYSNTQPEYFKEVSIIKDSYRHILPSKSPDRQHRLTFDITANRTSNYYVEVVIKDTSTVQTKLFKDDKKTLLAEG